MNLVAVIIEDEDNTWMQSVKSIEEGERYIFAWIINHYPYEEPEPPALYKEYNSGEADIDDIIYRAKEYDFLFNAFIKDMDQLDNDPDTIPDFERWEKLLVLK